MNIPNNNMKKLLFIYNALENGWSVKKKGDFYVFFRKHNNNRKYFTSSYIYDFVQSNIPNYGLSS